MRLDFVNLSVAINFPILPQVSFFAPFAFFSTRRYALGEASRREGGSILKPATALKRFYTNVYLPQREEVCKSKQSRIENKAYKLLCNGLIF